jgi:hypothetical protein
MRRAPRASRPVVAALTVGLGLPCLSGCLHPIALERGELLEDSVRRTPAPDSSVEVQAFPTTEGTLEVTVVRRHEEGIEYRRKWEEYVVVEKHPYGYKVLDLAYIALWASMGYGAATSTGLLMANENFTKPVTNLLQPGAVTIDSFIGNAPHYLVWDFLGLFNPFVVGCGLFLDKGHDIKNSPTFRRKSDDETIVTSEDLTKCSVSVVDRSNVLECRAVGEGFERVVPLDGSGRGSLSLPSGASSIELVVREPATGLVLARRTVALRGESSR